MPPRSLGHADADAVTLTFDLLTPNTEAFILVPNCFDAESLVKASAVICKITLKAIKQYNRQLRAFSSMLDPL